MKIIKHLLFVLVLLSLLSACQKEKFNSTLPPDIFEINSFIRDVTYDYYLWEDKIPDNINIDNYPDPYDLFEAMAYRTLDHWSFIGSDYREIEKGFEGIRKTFGYKLKFYKYIGSDNIFAMIEYVYTGGPAANAGLKRGDLFFKVNGQQLNTTNYQDLLSLDVMELRMGGLQDNQVVDLEVNVNIAAVEMNINPIQQYKVININDKIIGYFLYDSFTAKDSIELRGVIESFKTDGITDMILDLRYNPGGYVSTCADLASMIAPASALDDIFLTQQWNDAFTQYFTYYYGSNSEYFKSYFPVPKVNLNLSKLVVITSGRTASASEALINGLKPYMQVAIVGDTTVGKYTGATLLYDESSAVNKWGVYLIINKIGNADGVTDFVNGFAPDYLVEDDYTTPLGDENEPLLAKALEVITGIPVKSTPVSFSNKPFSLFYEHWFERDGMMISNRIKR